MQPNTQNGRPEVGQTVTIAYTVHESNYTRTTTITAEVREHTDANGYILDTGGPGVRITSSGIVHAPSRDGTTRTIVGTNATVTQEGEN